MPAFRGEASRRKSLVSHSIDGSFAIRQGDWKLSLSAGSGGWSSPKEAAAKKKGLPPMQLFNLNTDRGERKNLLEENGEQVETLIQLLDRQVTTGRSTPGNPIANDREIVYMPEDAMAK